MPPSTRILIYTSSVPPPDCNFFSSLYRRSMAIFGIATSLNSWPPNPGSTARMSTRSTNPESSNGSIDATGVSGLMDTPHFIPSDVTVLANATAEISAAPSSPSPTVIASHWNMRRVAPASARGCAYLSGRSTHRCTSSVSSGCRSVNRLRRLSIIWGPNVSAFGESMKTPSKTSTWSQGSPTSRHFWTSPFMSDQSDAKREGETITGAFLGRASFCCSWLLSTLRSRRLLSRPLFTCLVPLSCWMLHFIGSPLLPITSRSSEANDEAPPLVSANA
mmetsp:Transcript_4180/g.8894  ORF Transcript_4180/g.8894 Transcript_4180/m.8894 type:complete len:276 (-) Transcript_4180:2046-2873(-)